VDAQDDKEAAAFTSFSQMLMGDYAHGSAGAGAGAGAGGACGSGKRLRPTVRFSLQPRSDDGKNDDVRAQTAALFIPGADVFPVSTQHFITQGTSTSKTLGPRPSKADKNAWKSAREGMRSRDRGAVAGGIAQPVVPVDSALVAALIREWSDDE
jgi:hypothetical protein